MALKGATGKAGLQLLMQAAGVAIGAVYIDGVVVRAILWVVAASMLGAAVQALSKPGKSAS